MSPVHVKLIGHDEWRDEDIEQLRSLLELPAELNIHRCHDDDLAVEILLANPGRWSSEAALRDWILVRCRPLEHNFSRVRVISGLGSPT